MLSAFGDSIPSRVPVYHLVVALEGLQGLGLGFVSDQEALDTCTDGNSGANYYRRDGRVGKERNPETRSVRP